MPYEGKTQHDLEPKTGSSGFALLAAAFSSPLVIGLVIWLSTVPDGIASLNWQSHSGQLIYYTIPECSKASGGPRAFVEYNYIINNQKYIGQKIAATTFYLGWANDDCGIEELRQYVSKAKSRNGSIEVFVNPKNPRDAVLFRGVPTPRVFLKPFPFFLGGVTVYCLVSIVWMRGMRALNIKLKKRSSGN